MDDLEYEEVITLRAENKRLREALKVFMDASWSPIEDTRAISMTVNFDKYRAAKAAYTDKTHEPG